MSKKSPEQLPEKSPEVEAWLKTEVSVGNTTTGEYYIGNIRELFYISLMSRVKICQFIKKRQENKAPFSEYELHTELQNITKEGFEDHRDDQAKGMLLANGEPRVESQGDIRKKNVVTLCSKINDLSNVILEEFSKYKLCNIPSDDSVMLNLIKTVNEEKAERAARAAEKQGGGRKLTRRRKYNPKSKSKSKSKSKHKHKHKRRSYKKSSYIITRFNKK